MDIIAPGNSSHHLFTYHEIRAKLVQIYGQPTTDDDHQFLQREVMRIHKQMPQFKLDEQFHRRIHNEKQNKLV